MLILYGLYLSVQLWLQEFPFFWSLLILHPAPLSHNIPLLEILPAPCVKKYYNAHITVYFKTYVNHWGELLQWCEFFSRNLTMKLVISSGSPSATSSIESGPGVVYICHACRSKIATINTMMDTTTLSIVAFETTPIWKQTRIIVNEKCQLEAGKRLTFWC